DCRSRRSETSRDARIARQSSRNLTGSVNDLRSEVPAHPAQVVLAVQLLVEQVVRVRRGRELEAEEPELARDELAERPRGTVEPTESGDPRGGQDGVPVVRTPGEREVPRDVPRVHVGGGH